MTTDGYEVVARVADLPDGALLGVTRADGERICLGNDGGRIFAVSDTCTHQDFALCDGSLLPGGVLECAWHGAHFDVHTGAVRKAPAVKALPVYEVRVEDGRIAVGPRRPAGTP